MTGPDSAAEDLRVATILTPHIECLPDEVSMIKKFIAFIQNTDPDIFVGYEVRVRRLEQNLD